MKDISASLKNSIRTCQCRRLSALVVILALLILGQMALAQDEPVRTNGNDLQESAQKVKQYFIDKYNISKYDVTSTLEQTPNGPSGKLHIIGGNITPKNMVAGEGVHGRARAIAKAFLEEEAALLGITNIDEIREVKIKTIKGYGGDYSDIYYRRYINNLEIENMYIHITIGPDKTITGVSANLVPVSPELYEAVAKKTLTESSVLKVVEKDLKSAGIDPKVANLLDIEKLAIPSPPYVIWKVDVNLRVGTGRWKYKIDAFTGEILEKRYALQWFGK